MLFYFAAQGYSSGWGLHRTGYWEPPLYDKPMIVQFLCLYSTPKLGLYARIIMRFFWYRNEIKYVFKRNYCCTFCTYSLLWPSCLEKILSFPIYKQDFWSILKLFKGNLYESTSIVEIFKNIPDFSVKKVRWDLGSRFGFAGLRYGSRYGPESGKIMDPQHCREVSLFESFFVQHSFIGN